VRALGAWLALTYVCASTAGAAGIGGCIHADAEGEGHGHGTQATAPVYSAAHHHSDVPLPCASGEDHEQDLAESSSHHGASDPCDCLGDCSIGTGMADLSATPTPCAAGRLASSESLPSPDQVETLANQHRLPYPNAPPLL
jgi:hypothetical protein